MTKEEFVNRVVARACKMVADDFGDDELYTDIDDGFGLDSFDQLNDLMSKHGLSMLVTVELCRQESTVPLIYGKNKYYGMLVVKADDF